MVKNFSEFDCSSLEVKPLSQRESDLDLSIILPLQPCAGIPPALREVAREMKEAHVRKASCIMMLGGHVIRSGVQRYLIDMMQKRHISCIAVNGAVAIHDYELALIGATTENVATYIKDGSFGLWHETGRINDIVNQAAREKMGLGEAVGRAIFKEQFPYQDISILATAYALGIPLTVHVGIGYDIVHALDNCSGAAYGATSYRDFLRFARCVQGLEGGVIMNFGSAVMGPEVFLKALSMARNAARQHNRTISDFTTLVCDLLSLPDHYHEEPAKDDPHYFFRPFKTMLVRTVADGGRSHYVKGAHRETLPQLWTALEAL